MPEHQNRPAKINYEAENDHPNSHGGSRLTGRFDIEHSTFQLEPASHARPRTRNPRLIAMAHPSPSPTEPAATTCSHSATRFHHGRIRTTAYGLVPPERPVTERADMIDKEPYAGGSVLRYLIEST